MHLCLYTSVYMHCVLMYAYLLVYIYIYIFAKMYDFLERNWLKMALHPLFHPDAC